MTPVFISAIFKSHLVMKNISGQESLWVALPILVVIILLIAGLIFLPQAQTEIRSKASEPAKAIITPNPIPTQTEAPEIVCSDLYSPVCGVNGVTYSSACEANQDGVISFTEGICAKVIPTTGKPQNLLYTLPATN